MSYQYHRKSDQQIVKVAEAIRDLLPHRQDSNGHRWDVEGLIDDFCIRILPRRLNHKLKVEAYVARDPQVIVVAEYLYANTRRLRFTLAEELSHKVLEYRLWEEGKELPAGAGCSELSKEQYRDIEKDAKRLAAEILMPAADFTQQFKTHERTLRSSVKGDVDPDWLIRTLRDCLAGEFDVSVLSVGVRMRELRLITRVQYQKHLAPEL